MPRTAALKVDHVEVEPSTVKRLVRELNGEGEHVDAQYVEELLNKGLATDDVLTDPQGRRNVTPMEGAVKRAVAATKTKTAAKPATKTTAAKAAQKAKAERVPAETFVAELTRLHLTKTQAATALGVSPSLISEFVGKGRGTLMAKTRWTEAKAKLAAFAKGLK